MSLVCCRISTYVFLGWIAFPTIAFADDDAGKNIANFGNVVHQCKQLNERSALNCVYFVTGFLEGMAFHEHIYNRTPPCVGLANWHELGNKVIKRIREIEPIDPYTGMQLANIVMQELNCKYEKMK
ncbi:MAG: hypothetical protein HY244_01455 [Rhizobiales bacterium]|nr:hypothetical protein [Hyphomicrobiales bacterium]